MSEQLVYDFEDGNGPVPAHQHINPDGSTGGWVADTAYAAPTVHIGSNAKVYGDAHVLDNASIYDHACIYDRAYVYKNARVFKNAHVCGNTWVYGRAHIYGRAIVRGEIHVCGDTYIHENAYIHGRVLIRDQAVISGNADISADISGRPVTITGYANISGNACITNIKDYMVMGPLGGGYRYTTFTRYPVIRANTGCFTGTLEEFENAVIAKHGDTEVGKEYIKVINFIKHHYWI